MSFIVGAFEDLLRDRDELLQEALCEKYWWERKRKTAVIECGCSIRDGKIDSCDIHARCERITRRDTCQ